MKILAIETSCDETAISILECKGRGDFRVLSNELSSQALLHREYGGVYPHLAKREHIKNLPILFEKALMKAGVKKCDLVAVTSGPGLEPALWTGIVFAQDLAKKWDVPIMPINHMEGHIISVFGKNNGEFNIPKINYPILSLLVSGGHTELVYAENFGKYKVIGETVDDAVGEAFDKVARILGLPYPGGPEISKLAEEERKNKKSYQFSFPRPMLKTNNFNFSYSGLKTSILYFVKKIGELDEKTKKEIALQFENAAIEPLIYKTKKALEKFKAATLIVAGGVSANRHLRREVRKEIKGAKVIFPDQALSTDNSIMIGMVAYLKYLGKKGKIPKSPKIEAVGNLRLK